MIFITHQFFLLSHQNSPLTQEAELGNLEQSQGQGHYKSLLKNTQPKTTNCLGDACLGKTSLVSQD